MVKHTKENGTKEGIETSLKKEFDTDSDSISVAGGQTYSSDEGLEESETGSEYSESEELMTDEKEDTDKEENDVDFVLARVELANAMLNMDPKAVIIEKNKLKTNKETLDSLMGNKNISNNSHITGKSVSRRKNSKKIKKNRRDSESRDEESRETGLDLIDDKDDVLSGYKVREWNNQKRMSKENEVYDKSNGNRKQRQKNNVTDSDADADFQGYGENKIPDFIIQAKSMKDIDEITQNWEENLKQEQEGGFWGSVIKDIDGIKNKTPHLLTSKIRSGIPEKIRGVVWQVLAKGRSTFLQTMYSQLVKEHSPHERTIQRDLSRTFPCITVFKDTTGEGQKRLFNILKAYSLYDAEVGYCQGLGFVIGPLMLNMGECEAFCVLVQLMETYDMRRMFTENMDGLHLRLYQFNELASQVVPEVCKHLHAHGIHPAMYAASWFLSLFAYALPLGLVLRIIDIALYEGATETIIRVGITLLKRNEERIVTEDEFEGLMNILASGLYDANNELDQPSYILSEASLLSNIVTRAKLDELADVYNLKNNNKRAAETRKDSNKSSIGKYKKDQVNINKAIMNLLGFGRREPGAYPKQPGASKTGTPSAEARGWLTEMQARQQEQHQAVAQGETSDSMIGFDFLALSGFDSTRRISNSDTSTTDSSESVETKMRKNRKDSAKTSHEKQSPSHSGKASPMSQSVRTNSSHEDYLPSHRHRDDTGPGARSEPPGLHKSEVDTLVQQLHNARVTADTSLHALADLRTEHSILLDQLAQVKLEKAELDGYVGQLRMLVKSVEMERKAAVEKCEKLDHELQQTENALVKARMKCADFEDDRSTASGELHKLGSFVHELNKAGLIKVELPGEISRIVLSCASTSSHNSNSNPNSNTSYKFMPRDSQPNTAQKASKSKYSLLQSFGMGGGGNSNINSNSNNSGDTNPVDNTPRSMNYGVGGRFSHSLHRGTLGGGMRHSTSLSTASPPANIDLINDVVSFARSSVGNASSPFSRRPNVDHSRPYRNSRIPSKSINPSLFGITSSGSASPSPNVSANTSPNPSPNASANTNVSVSGADGNTNI